MPSPAEILGQPFILNHRVTIKNRFFKSAMSEGLGDVDNAPTEKLPRLYGTWAKGGAGLLVTGNVMIDRQALGEPRNVVVEDESNLELLKGWAEAGTKGGTHLWMQINHPGKQIPKMLNRQPVAPSAIPLGHGLESYFALPRELTGEEIEDLIARYGNTAGIAKKAGFTGVQIHGAHGYLVSQFLSPQHNQRTDKWGGSLENRMRFALAVYESVRARVGMNYPVAIKLNSADFQKGGFSEEESMDVVKALADAGIDLIEISGGTYENPIMTGTNVPRYIKESTLQREAYFLEYAGKVRQYVRAPLVVTGGFRSAKGMAEAIRQGATDLVGLARPFAVHPDFPNRILNGEPYKSPVKPITTGIKRIDNMGMLNITWHELQLHRIGRGKPVKENMSAWRALFNAMVLQGFQSFKKRRA